MRAKILASLNAFTFSGAQVLLIALFPFLAERLGLSLAVVVGSFGLGSALFLVGTPFWSNQSDRLGRAPVLAAGSFGLFLSLFILWGLLRYYPGATFALPLLAASRVVYGFLSSAIAPVAQSLQADSAKDPAAAMHLHSWSLNLGRAFSLVAFVALGLEPETLLAAFLIWVAGLTALNILFSFASFTRASSPAPARAGEIKWIFAVAFSFACFVETLNSSLGGFLKSRFDLEGIAASTLTARLLLACALGVVLIQTLTRALRLFRLSPDWIMACGALALVAGGFFLTGAEKTEDLLLAVALLSVGIGLLPPVYLAQIRSGASYGKRAGLVGFAHTAGYSAGMGLAALRFQFNAVPLQLLLTAIALSMLGFFFASRRAIWEAA